jgi:predicted acetyltransferase
MAVDSEGFALLRATADDAAVLERLLELYAHELSDVFKLELDESGRFGYDKLKHYFHEPEVRHAFLVRHRGHLAGFALATRGSPASADPEVYDVAEFFVVRAHRRAGLGRQVAFRLFDALPGRWFVRVSKDNSGALEFWARVVEEYARGEKLLSTRPGRSSPWQVYEFKSRT